MPDPNRQFIFLKQLRQVLPRCCVSDRLGHLHRDVGHNYVNYFLLTWLPFYLVRERHFQCMRGQDRRAAYLIGACLSIASGWAPIIDGAGATPTRVRKDHCAGGLEPGGFFFFYRPSARPLKA